MKIIAHRGASFIAPENTFSSFEQAWLENADGIELDVRLTKDNKIVAMHDRTTSRTSDLSLDINQSSYKELHSADVGSWKSKKYKGEKIPLLEKILELLPENKDIYIEIKDNEKIIPALEKIIFKFYHLKNNIIIMSFSYTVIKKIKSILPEYNCLWIVEFGYNVPKFSKNNLLNVIRKTLTANLNGISSFSNLEDCKNLAPLIKENSFFWNVWTVDNPHLAKEMKMLGLDSLSTNRPEWIRKHL
jgi:glycerophosphoryl diester phosphodiesterase